MRRALPRRVQRTRSRPRYHFFSGKGGVGKTTCAAAFALTLAEEGRRVLLLSTDPAHSLKDVLALPLSSAATALPTRAGQLFALELNADQALSRWLSARKRSFHLIAERGTYLDADDIEQLFSLSLPGVDELVGLVEIERLGRQGRYEEVVIDTAPTGHTLRLLEMPQTLSRLAVVLDDMQAKHRFLAESLGGVYHPDRSDAVITEIEQIARNLRALLSDPARCRFSWVLLPEALSVEETIDGVAKLGAMGIMSWTLILNQVTPPPQTPCVRCELKAKAERESIAALCQAFPQEPLRLLMAQEKEPRGLDALRHLGKALAEDAPLPASAPRRQRARSTTAKLPDAPPAWLSELVPEELRLLLFGGKGGVGKTTCAAACALALAQRFPKRRILLLSADPAHSLADVLKTPLDDKARSVPGAPPSLFARELDADAAFQEQRSRYQKAVDDFFSSLFRGSSWDATFDRAVLEDLIDIAPPGIDEIFAILSVVSALGLSQPLLTKKPSSSEEAPYDIVVLDTAPTGHALRLLEMPRAAADWLRMLLSILLKYREVIGLGEFALDLVSALRQVKQLIALLRDPQKTRFVAVTRAAALPRLETARLLSALSRLEIPLGAVLVNAVRGSGCPRCQRAMEAEAGEIALFKDTPGSLSGAHCAMMLAPALAPPPRGVEALSRFVVSWRKAET